MSDLGACEQAIEHFKGLVRTGEEAPIRAFEDQLIDITVRMIEGGVLDFDHGLINMVVPTSGQPIRLDLEHAKVYRWHRWRTKLRARMLGHLVLTHLFAVQPNSAITEAFSRRLFSSVPVTSQVSTAIEQYVWQALERQESEIGLKVAFQLPRC